VDGLDDGWVVALELKHVVDGLLHVVPNFAKHVVEVLVVEGEGVFENVETFLTGLNEGG
jgi:hypothetical protein